MAGMESREKSKDRVIDGTCGKDEQVIGIEGAREGTANTSESGTLVSHSSSLATFIRPVKHAESTCIQRQVQRMMESIYCT